MDKENKETQKKDNKKLILIILIVIVSMAFVASAYAVISQVFKINQKITTGTLTLQDINVKIENRLTGLMEDTITQWSPGDASILTWDTVNTGTAAVNTRHIIQVYWDETDIDDDAKNLLELYPANMTNAEVLTDYNNTKTKAKQVDRNKIDVDGVQKTGISFMFYGDILDGTDKTGFATEVNYNDEQYGESTFTAKETNNLSDKIAFRVLLSPNTSYLYQEKHLSIRVITEAMQYSQDGVGEWVVQSTKVIN